VLLFNGEEVVMQRLTGEIEFDPERDGWSDIPDLSSRMPGVKSAALAQPLR
jgi:hypothetical protein